MKHICLLLLIFCMATPALFATDAETQALFDELFGDQYEKAKRSATKLDNGEVAKNMLEAVENLEGADKLKLLVWIKVVEIAHNFSKNAQYADAARNKIAEHAPDKLIEVDKMMLAHYQQLVKTSRDAAKVEAANKAIDVMISLGDYHLKNNQIEQALKLYQDARLMCRVTDQRDAEDLAAKINQVREVERITKTAEQLKAKLLKDPNDKKAATQLTNLLFFELDTVQEAATYAPFSDDATLAKLIPLAAKPMGEIETAQLYELAKWTWDQFEELSDVGKITAQRRSEAWLKHFMATYEKDDVTKLKAKVLLGKVEVKAKKTQAEAIVKDNDNAVKKGPPEDAIKWRGHHYLAVTDYKTWEEAKKEAEARGGQLVCVETPNEAQFLFLKFNGKLSNSWTGGVQKNNRRFWINGRPFRVVWPKTRWTSNTNSNKLAIHFTQQTMRGEMETNRYQYIVEWEK